MGHHLFTPYTAMFKSCMNTELVAAGLTVHVAAGGGSEITGVEVLVRLQPHHLRRVVAKNPADSGGQRAKKGGVMIQLFLSTSH